MKVRKYPVVLAAVGICAAALAVWMQAPGASFSAGAAFPFEQMGLLLRALSLSGSAGNGAAVALYVFLSLLPAGYLCIRWMRNRLRGEDALLMVLSGLLFYVLHRFINPGLLGVMNNAVGKSVLGGTVYSVLVAYAVLRTVRTVKGMKTNRLYAVLYRLLGVLGIVVCVLGVWNCMTALLSRLDALHSGNTDRDALTVSYLVLVLGCAVQLLPCGMNLGIIRSARQTVLALGDGADEAAVQAAEALWQDCSKALKWLVLLCAGYNLLQLLLAGLARDIHITLLIPLENLVLILAALLLARLVRDMKRIRDENESFI